MFAVLDQYDGRPCLAFRAASERQDEYLADERFFAAPYAARFGWVCLRADTSLDWREVAELVRGSYRQVALKRMLAALDAEEADASEGSPKTMRPAYPRVSTRNRANRPSHDDIQQ